MINIYTLEQLENILNNKINISQFLSICTKTVLLRNLHLYINKDLHSNIFNITNNQELINNILMHVKFTNQDIQNIEYSLNEYIKTKKIQLSTNIKLNINEDILKQFLNKYLFNSPYMKLIYTEIKNIQNKKLPLTLKDILNSNLKIGEYIPISQNIIKKELHSLYVKPLIYINGNIIEGNIVSTYAAYAQREHHNQILMRYLNDMSLHKNDIIQLSAVQWKKCDIWNIYSICDYVRAVMNDDIIILLYDEPAKNIAIPKLYEKYKKSIYIITDNACNMQKLARRLANKYIIRIM